MTFGFLSSSSAVLALGTCLLMGAQAHAQNEGTPENPNLNAKSGAMKDDTGAVKVAKVYFTNVKDGQKIPKDMVVKFAVEGMKVMKSGDVVPGTGHFHVLIDAPPVKEGEVVPADGKHIHLGLGQTETRLNLTPGPHTLVLEFADGQHRAFGTHLQQEVHVIAQ